MMGVPDGLRLVMLETCNLQPGGHVGPIQPLLCELRATSNTDHQDHQIFCEGKTYPKMQTQVSLRDFSRVPEERQGKNRSAVGVEDLETDALHCSRAVQVRLRLSKLLHGNRRYSIRSQTHNCGICKEEMQ